MVTLSNTFSGGTNSTNSTNGTESTPLVYGGRVKTTTIALASNVYRPALVFGKGWGVRDLSAGGSHTLVLRHDGSLWAMGANELGQLGLGALTRGGNSTNGGGTNTNSTDSANGFRTVTITNLVTNINHAPWRVETNVDTTIDQASVYRPRRVGTKWWKSVAAGQGHSLAVRSDGTLWAWGDNASAQLGNGTLVSTNRPVQVGAANRWVAAFAGSDHNLALQKDGTLWAWGKHDGRLGILGAEETESPFREIPFGVSGQATLVVEEGRGHRSFAGSGLVSFFPEKTNVVMALQMDVFGSPRAEWSGAGTYRASRHRLVFSNLALSPAEGTDRTLSSAAISLGEMKSSWWQPDTYRGTAVVGGTNCRATMFFSGDADRDGIPDFADASPRGSVPSLSPKLQIRIKVGDPVQYELPGLSEGATPILSSSLSDLPSGLEYGEGSITGVATPEAVGTHEVVVGAANEAGESYQTLKIEVVPPNPVLEEEEERMVWTNGTTVFSYAVQVGEAAYQGYPFMFRAKNIPPGLVLERGSGVLRPARRSFSGVPAPGLYRITVTVSHRGGGVANQVLVVESMPGPSGRWQVGRPLRFQVRLGGKGATEIAGLPPGLRVNAGGGLIQGVPTEAGDFSVTAKQRDGGRWLEESFILGVDPAGSPQAKAPARAGSAVHGNGTGWSYPAIFSIGTGDSQVLQGNGVGRQLSPITRSYALLWTNVEGWKWDNPAPGLSTRLKEAEKVLRQSELLVGRQAVPSAVRLARISYASAQSGTFLPTNHVFWLKDAGGRSLFTAGEPGLGLLDFSQPAFLQRLGERVKFLVQNGCVDGVYLPEWSEAALWPTNSVPAKAKPGGQGPARLELLQTLRAAVGPGGWIVAEAAGESWALTGPSLDAVHLVGATEAPSAWPPAEGWWPDPYSLRDPDSPETLWQKLVNSLKFFGQPGVLRRPGNVAMELWARQDLNDARTKEPRLAGLAMSLCLSDGTYLYARPDWWQEEGKAVAPGEHLWFPEWSVRLGRALESRRTQPEDQGVYRRQYEYGWAVYAPVELPAIKETHFTEEVESVATGKTGRTHRIAPGHGDLFLKKN